MQRLHVNALVQQHISVYMYLQVRVPTLENTNCLSWKIHHVISSHFCKIVICSYKITLSKCKSKARKQVALMYPMQLRNKTEHMSMRQSAKYLTS